jgi:arginyl-tRNA synthetase
MQQPNEKPVHTTSDTGKPMAFGGAQFAINIIDVRQSYSQALLKLAFEIIGRKDAANSIIHLAYGRVDIEGGTLSGRQGTWLEYTADKLLEETMSKASTLITERSKLTKAERENVSNKVALSAIKFEFLKFAPESGILFSWANALNFEGNSGPYCQYMFARATRLLEDSKMSPKQLAEAGTEALAEQSAFALVKMLSKTKEIVEKTCTEVRPNVLTGYAIDLATAFSTFYESSPMLKAATEEEKFARLALTFAFANTMAIILNLLGIEPIEKM